MSREGGAGSNGSVGACRGCFSSPDWATPSERKALLDAAKIAGFAEAKVRVSLARLGDAQAVQVIAPPRRARTTSSDAWGKVHRGWRRPRTRICMLRSCSYRHDVLLSELRI